MRVLIIDEDSASRDVLSTILQRGGVSVVAARHAESAVKLGKQYQPELVVLLTHQVNGAELAMINEFWKGHLGTPFVVMDRRPPAWRVVPFDQVGANTYALAAQISRLVTLANTLRQSEELTSSPCNSGESTVAHAAVRWAEAVVRVIDCPSDPKTISRWGRWAAVSPGALRNWCRTADIPAKRSLNFARVLRAVVRQSPGDRAQNIFDAVDLRTVAVLLRLGRPDGARPLELPRDAEEFLHLQQWVTDARALDETRNALRVKASTQRDE